MPPTLPPRRRAFTLIEILIVVVILGILAAIVIPKFSNASQLARQNTLRDDLRFLRSRIMVYTAHHHGVPPGIPPGGGAADAQTFIAQMTHPTDAKGHVGALSQSGYRFGPYLSRMPENPINGLSTIRIVGPGPFPDTAEGTHGWIYQPSTLNFAAGAKGTDTYGTAYIDY